MNRRNALKTLAGAGATVLLPPWGGAEAAAHALQTSDIWPTQKPKNLGYKTSFARWCLDGWDLDKLCGAAVELGLDAIDLVGPEDWHILKKHGLHSSMCNGAELNLVDGFIHPEHHSALHARYREMIPRVAKEGYKRLICFAGNRRGMSEEEGMANALKGLRPMVELAEEHGVELCLEVFNSKIDHPDYMADHSAWAFQLAEQLQSLSFGILYDIYHMQLMEGDIIGTIQKNWPYIKHYHVAGVPGRMEPDHFQEVNYPAIMTAIQSTGFKGYVALEYLIKGDPMPSLRSSMSALYPNMDAKVLHEPTIQY
jgi:hydroxypyruvate isomerase